MKMKYILKLIALIVLLPIFIGCEKKNAEIVEKQLDINPRSLNAVWQLEKMGETTIPSGSYFYLELMQEDMEFHIYENLNSSFANDEPGKFELYDDTDAEKTAIYGSYTNHFSKEWEEDYYINSLTKSKMVWEGLETKEILTFVKVEKVSVNEKQF